MQHGHNNINRRIAARLLTKSIQKVSKEIEQQNIYLRIIPETPTKKDEACQTIDIQQISTKNLQRLEVNTPSQRDLQSRFLESKITNKYSNREMETELSERARQFVLKLRNRKKQIEGKFVLKKMEEEQRKKQKSRKKEIQEKVQKQIDKQMRKLRAQKNIQYYQQKQKLYNKSNNSLSPIKQTNSLNNSYKSLRKRTLPSIYATQLEEIKEQPTTRKLQKLNLDKTVMKSQKKRSNTVADIRDQQENESNEIKLFDKNQNKKNYRSSLKQSQRHKKQQSQISSSSYYDQDKKNYLMTRNKTQDISIYLQKYSNVHQIRNWNRNLSERNNMQNKILRNKEKKRYLMKSSTDRNDLEENNQHEHEHEHEHQHQHQHQYQEQYDN